MSKEYDIYDEHDLKVTVLRPLFPCIFAFILISGMALLILICGCFLTATSFMGDVFTPYQSIAVQAWVDRGGGENGRGWTINYKLDNQSEVDKTL